MKISNEIHTFQHCPLGARVMPRPRTDYRKHVDYLTIEPKSAQYPLSKHVLTNHCNWRIVYSITATMNRFMLEPSSGEVEVNSTLQLIAKATGKHKEPADNDRFKIRYVVLREQEVTSETPEQILKRLSDDVMVLHVPIVPTPPDAHKAPDFMREDGVHTLPGYVQLPGSEFTISNKTDKKLVFGIQQPDDTYGLLTIQPRMGYIPVFSKKTVTVKYNRKYRERSTHKYIPELYVLYKFLDDDADGESMKVVDKAIKEGKLRRIEVPVEYEEPDDEVNDLETLTSDSERSGLPEPPAVPRPLSIEPRIVLMPKSFHKLCNSAYKRIKFHIKTNSNAIRLLPSEGEILENSTLTLQSSYSPKYTGTNCIEGAKFTIHWWDPEKRSSWLLKPEKPWYPERGSFKVPVAFSTEERELLIAEGSNCYEARNNLKDTRFVREGDAMRVSPNEGYLPSSYNVLLNRTAYQMAFRATTTSSLMELRPHCGFVNPHSYIELKVKYHDRYYKNRIRKEIEGDDHMFKIHFCPVPDNVRKDEKPRDLLERARYVGHVRLPVTVIPAEDEAEENRVKELEDD